jgi:myosin heavy chain 6/7
VCSGDVEKAKRKVEGDLKLTQEAVSDLERNKKELEQTIQRKDKEISSLAAKLEDEQSLVAKLQKQIKELQVKSRLHSFIFICINSPCILLKKYASGL